MDIDTSNILFICGVAFAGLEDIINHRLKGSSIGFGAEVKSVADKKIGEFDVNYRINSFSYSPDREHDVMAADCLVYFTWLSWCKKSY